MSGLIGDLFSSSQAMVINQRKIGLAGQNLAHVDDAQYARQRLETGTGARLNNGGVGSLALQSGGVEHMRSQLLDGRIVEQSSLESAFRMRLDIEGQIEDALGEYLDFDTGGVLSSGEVYDASDGSLSGALGAFFNAFDAYAANPNSKTHAQDVVAKGESLVERMQNVDVRLQDVADHIEAEGASAAEEANQLLGRVDELNKQIVRAESGGEDQAGVLRDARQAALEELSQLMDFELSYSDGGLAEVSVEDTGGGSVVLLNNVGVQRSLSFSGGVLSAGSSALTVSGGAVHGLMNAQTRTLEPLRAGLDALAGQLVSAVNGAYNPGGAQDDFFDVSGTTVSGLALDGTLTAETLRSDIGGSGSNEAALAVAAVANQAFDSGVGDLIDGTLSEFMTGLSTSLAQTVESTGEQLRGQELFMGTLRQMRSSQSGVSMDEELADMIRFQRTFEASAQVFRVVDRLLDVVVNELGR